jgi:large subunit ribosomal protein L28
MSRKCDLTGKKKSFGHNKKHARGSSGGGGIWRFKAPKTKRDWKPNLRKIKVLINGTPRTIKVSMKAYKKLRKLTEKKDSPIVLTKNKKL